MQQAQVQASIITIGDELLIGQTVDTNSAFIARELNKIGVWVHRRVAVGDDYDAIWDALDEESEASQIIIITGGLGPTADDITKPLLCDYFGGKMVVNQQVLEHVKYLFEKVFKRPGPLLERNIKQAEVPDVCEVLFNKRGTAPGMMFAPQPPKAPLNPPQGGTLASQSRKVVHSYETGDTLLYGKLKEFAEEHRKQPTEAENVLWQLLKGRKLSGFKFRRQHIIGPFIADFVCLSKKLIIEVDGLIHQLPENQLSDEERTVALNEKGFEVIRFTNEQVLYGPDQTLNSILARLKEEKIPNTGSKNPPLEGREAIFFSLPGVPFEMKGLITEEVIPRLANLFELPAIVHRTAFTAGQGESFLAELLKDYETSLPGSIKLAYLPNFGMVKLRLTAKGDDRETVEKEITPYFDRLQELVSDYLVANEDIGLEIVVGRLLKARGKTMGTAESCTGGYIAHLLTSVPGSSAYYKGSVVSYANDVKEGILDVSDKTLQAHGAVSRETVTEMAQGALRKLGVDYALATSGIMGPDGGTPEKPVGTVWIAAAGAGRVETIQLHLRFERERNISQTATSALNFLRKFILST